MRREILFANRTIERSLALFLLASLFAIFMPDSILKNFKMPTNKQNSDFVPPCGQDSLLHWFDDSVYTQHRLTPEDNIDNELEVLANQSHRIQSFLREENNMPFGGYLIVDKRAERFYIDLASMEVCIVSRVGERLVVSRFPVDQIERESLKESRLCSGFGSVYVIFPESEIRALMVVNLRNRIYDEDFRKIELNYIQRRK